MHGWAAEGAAIRPKGSMAAVRAAQHSAPFAAFSYQIDRVTRNWRSGAKVT
jgi:hypothetical protein